jgi:hypothetical protein
MDLATYRTRYQQLKDWGGGPWDEKVNKMFFSAGAGAATRGNRSHIFEINSTYSAAEARGFPLKEYGRYRYLVYAYGHCGWSRRLHELVFFSSVVLMEDSLCREYMHYAFEPSVHFIPVAEDFSDLEVKLLAAVEDEAGSREMAKKWMEIGPDSLSLSCTLDYIDQLLRAYAKRQDFSVTEDPSWPLYTVGDGVEFFRLGGNLPNYPCKDHPRLRSEGESFGRSHVC